MSMAIQDEILRLKGLGHSKRVTAKLLGINRETVRKYWNGPEEISIKDIPGWVKEIDWEYINGEINKKRATRKILYEELKETIELPSYQAFCEYFKSNREVKDPQIVLKIHRSPGESVEVDYSGDGWEILNPATGELHRAELFVGSLSYSGDFYAEFTFTQKLEDFINSHVNMFNYFGGVASYIVPDNCKTAVTRANKLDPTINSTYQDLCSHFGTVVDPADPYSPRHKPNVENAVKLIQTDFFSRIRDKTFTSLFELNQELRKWILKKRNEVVQGRGQSRKFFFEKEKEFLRPLPEEDYELSYFKKAKVHPDCHFQHQKNYYSVPYQYVGKELDIKFNKNMIHAFYECKRIVTHKVVIGTYHYSTNTAHYPEKKIVEYNYHIQHAKKEASKVGENTRLLVDRLVSRASYPLKILRKVQGILTLSKKFEREAFEHACDMALEFDRLNYDSVRRFAKSYKKINTEPMATPYRQAEFICLQGGISE